jgi:hypothetical protein
MLAENSVDHPETDLLVNALGTLRVLESDNLRSSDLVFVINQQLRDYAIDMGASKEKTIIFRSRR